MKLLIAILAFFTLSFATLAEDVKLTKDNHVFLRGEVNSKSVAELSAQLLKISGKLDEKETIYLVIDSGGGSVFDGIDLLNVMEIIPQPIHTVSFFAFSMAYSISQRGDKRFIAKRGIMGQHRAKGGFSGQFAYGEVEQRLGIVTKVILDLEGYEAEKLGMSLGEFQKTIKDEMYVYYTDAVKKKVADGVANVSCSKDLIKTYEIRKQCSLFGCFSARYSKCPMIKGAIPVVKTKRDND